MNIKKSRVLAIIISIILTSFVAFLFLYPLGLQAVILGGVKDVVLLSNGKPVNGEVQVYASNETVYCYPDLFELRNEGVAGLSYSLKPMLVSSSGVDFLELRANKSLVIGIGGGLNHSRVVILAPGSSVSLDLCIKAKAAGSFRLVFLDSSHAKATKVEAAVSFKLVDWWNNSFSKRVTLTPIIAREGIGLFEITGGGEVYVNGRLVRRISSLVGTPTDSIVVVLKSGGSRYILPFQVEAWGKTIYNVIIPLRLKVVGEQLQGQDRIVFPVYLTNGTRIEIYFGGSFLGNFTTDIRASDNTVIFGSESVRLDEWGLSGKDISINLSGYIVYPLSAKREELSDEGSWRLTVLGPVRAVYVFNTTGISNYRIEAIASFWGRGVEATQITVWPRIMSTGMVIEWVSTKIYAGKDWESSFDCGTTCLSLPVRLVPGNLTKVLLCDHYYTPPAQYGYYLLLFSRASLAEIKSMAASFSSFPGG